MSGTTSIDELPIAGSPNDPVQLQVSGAPPQLPQAQDSSIRNEKVDSAAAMRRMEEERKQLDVSAQGQRIPAQHALSQEDASSLVSGLQNAAQAGVLSLPSRDIPMVSSQVAMDGEARVNYVPQPPTGQPDYIGNTQTADEIIAHSNKIKSREDTMDSIYEELQTPLLIGIMFFVFMIPSVRSFMFKSFPMLLQTDGNPTLGGYVYIAGLFGLIYYVLNKLMFHFSQV
jgi:hypothetical protein